jgi:phospholipase/carboxylesterase
MKITKQNRLAAGGGLAVCVVEDGDRVGPPSSLVVLCHGFGAPATDLVGLAAEMLHGSPGLPFLHRARFAFPAAPLDLHQGGGRAWWHIDMMALHQAIASGSTARFDEAPDGLVPARRSLLATIEMLLTEAALPWSRLVVGGFSQGAMLTTDLVLRAPEAPAALAILSGTLMTPTEWQRLAVQRRGLRVLQSHGRSDPVLPYERADQLRHLLLEAEMNVEFVPFQGGHGIAENVIDALAAVVDNVSAP